MVAIILVNFNNAEDTIDCIFSLKELTYSDYRIIVVDNNSTDVSMKKLYLAQEQYDFVLLTASKNKGFSAGSNIGIRYAMQKHADYILLLNNDTLVEANFLEELLGGFAEDVNCGATTGKIYYEKKRDMIWYAGGELNPHTARLEHWKYGQPVDENNNIPQKVTFATGCCICIDRRVIEKIGLFDEDYFLYVEDAEYSFRIIDAGYSIVYVPSAVIYHKVSASTGQASPVQQYYSTRNKYYMIRQHFKGRDKLMAYAYSTFQMIFRCIKGELGFRQYFSALVAFGRHEIGKRENLR